ncbi:serine protease inhibitor swm-1-like [Anomaloglossus baeobatrachus]|uniref:serine protease inhibitor swm-1-like n=1 Tax=Anomaloglossus baeobatrachus TaxID=238106 RepID=UPI003F50ADF1
MARSSAALLASLSLLVMVIAAHSAATCKAGEEYTTCGSSCPQTCGDNSERACPAVCVPGCFCKKGTIRNEKGECVKVAECCSGNTTYSECGNDCPNTCEAISGPPVFCTADCSSGCFCDPGYVRLPGSKKCVRPEDCPKSSDSY